MPKTVIVPESLTSWPPVSPTRYQEGLVSILVTATLLERTPTAITHLPGQGYFSLLRISKVKLTGTVFSLRHGPKPVIIWYLPNGFLQRLQPGLAIVLNSARIFIRWMKMWESDSFLLFRQVTGFNVYQAG